MSKYWEYNKDSFATFIDFQNACDNIIIDRLWTKHDKFDIPKKL